MEVDGQTDSGEELCESFHWSPLFFSQIEQDPHYFFSQIDPVGWGDEAQLVKAFASLRTCAEALCAELRTQSDGRLSTSSLSRLGSGQGLQRGEQL